MSMSDYHKDPHKELLAEVHAVHKRLNYNVAHPELDAIRIKWFVRDNGEVFDVVKYNGKPSKAVAWKAGGAGVLHDVYVRLRSGDWHKTENPLCKMKIFKDGDEWFIELNLPGDKEAVIYVW